MIVVKNPANGQVVESFNEASETQIDEVFTKLRNYDFSRAVDMASRKQGLLDFARAIELHTEELASLLSTETGKPIVQARNEVADTAKRTRYFVENFSHVGDARLMRNGPKAIEEIRFEPLGLILCISAWNYPYYVSTNVILPALLAGCRVVFKPSELATLCGVKLVELIKRQAALAEGIEIIKGGKDVGRMLVERPFDGIFFTGSEPAGLAIKGAIGNRMIRSQFELGGKDAAYICEDCDLASTLHSVVDGGFFNAGQSCCSIERIYVHEQIADLFKVRFTQAVSELKMGLPHDEATYLGPLTRHEHIAFLTHQVADAVSKGAQILTGGQRVAGNGNYFMPTVIWDARDNMEVMTEESFGPIVAVEVVKDDEEAIAKINASRFGLTGAVFSQNQKRAESILQRLDVGTVYWNCCDRASARLPWSGRKNSGLGVTLSTLGMEMFYKPKAWMSKIG